MYIYVYVYIYIYTYIHVYIHVYMVNVSKFILYFPKIFLFSRYLRKEYNMSCTVIFNDVESFK